MHSRSARSKCLFHWPCGAQAFETNNCSHDDVWKQRIIVADCNIVFLQQLNSQKRKTLGMPTYLLSNGKRSAIKPFTPPRQVAVSGSGTLARPTSSLQQMAPAGNKLQKATEFKHPAGLSSWDVGQVSTSGQDLQVPSSSIVQYPQVPSPSTMRYTQQQHSPGSYSLASNSSTVRYPHAYSSSEGRYPQQTLQVQQSRASDSSSEMRQTGICWGDLSIHKTLQMLTSPKFCVYLYFCWEMTWLFLNDWWVEL